VRGDGFREVGRAFQLKDEGFVRWHGGGDGVEGGDAFRREARVPPGAGVEGLQFFQGERVDASRVRGDTLEGIVMKGDNRTVGGEAEIGLDGVGTLLPSEVERGEGVFRCVTGGSAVGDDAHGSYFMTERLMVEISSAVLCGAGNFATNCCIQRGCDPG